MIALGELPDRPDSSTWRENQARLEPLQERLGRVFARPALLRVALTHPTWAHEHARSGWPHNGRLEFFGDAVLYLIATEALWRRFPGLAEGALTRLRAALISTAALAEAARRVGLGPLLWVAHKSQALREHEGTLADAAEAVLAAAYLDARAADDDPLAVGAGVFRTLLGPQFDALAEGDGVPVKARLQEWAQARWRRAPVYVTEEGAGRAPRRVRAEVICPDGQVIQLGVGEGQSTRSAETAAAADALARIERGELDPSR